MEKKLYERPEIEIISFAAKENLATGGLDNSGDVPDEWLTT